MLRTQLLKSRWDMLRPVGTAVVVLVLLLLLHNSLSPTLELGGAVHKYFLVVDAGSSGSRMYIYRYDPTARQSVPGGARPSTAAGRALRTLSLAHHATVAQAARDCL